MYYSEGFASLMLIALSNLNVFIWAVVAGSISFPFAPMEFSLDSMNYNVLSTLFSMLWL